MIVNIFKFRIPGTITSMQGAKKFRDHFAGQFPAGSHAHNHGEAGLLYGYPLVQYVREGKRVAKIVVVGGIDGNLVGIEGDPDDILLSLGLPEISDERLGEDPGACYRVRNLILGDKALRRIRRGACPEKEIVNALRRSISGLVAALTGQEIDPEVKVLGLERTTGQAFKGVTLSPYRVTFTTNLEIPTSLGLGRLVSHGYGRIKKLDKC